MRKLLVVLSVFFVFAFAGSALACDPVLCPNGSTLYYEEYTGNQFVTELETYNFGFDLWLAGNVSDTSSLTLTTDAIGATGTYQSGYVYFKISDNDDTKEKVNISFDISLDGHAAYDLGTYEFDLDGTPSYVEKTIALTSAYLNTLDNSGAGTVYLNAVSAYSSHNNDFSIKAVGLGVCNEPNPTTTTPEPASMLLLGLGLVGLAGVRRKFQKK